MIALPKLLLIGWDGATFDILNPLVNRGSLPNFTALMQSGAWGPLESTLPTLTPTAWTSISTGVNPGKHAIFDALIYSRREHRIHLANAAFRQVKPVWSLLSERDRSVGVMNVPVTYPADQVNGFVIPGMFTPPGLTHFFHPPQLYDEVGKAIGKYLIECRQVDDPSRYLPLLLDMIEHRERAILYMLKNYPVDFAFFTFVASDRAQHFFWKYLSADHPQFTRYHDYIDRIYIRLDQSLGAILSKIPAETHVMMVSDHGAGPLDHAFFLNNWLMQEGYLYFKDGAAEALSKGMASAFKSLVKRKLKKLLPESIIQRLRVTQAGDDHGDINAVLSAIDWDRSIAFSEGVGGGIYLNPQTVREDDHRAAAAADIISSLKELTGPDGRKVVAEVHIREEIYHGEHVQDAPDLIVVCNSRYQVIAPNELLYFNRRFDDQIFMAHRWSARHEKDGIFLLKGPDVLRGEVDTTSVLDIAPTALYLMGEPIPQYMDGKVVETVISRDRLERTPIAYCTEGDQTGQSPSALSADEEMRLMARLKNLGYIE